MSQAALTNTSLSSALSEARERYVANHPESRAQHTAACNSLPGGNTRTVLFFDPFPLTFVRGEGQYLWDADGRRYTDFLGEYTAGLFGHSDPTIRAAIDAALDGGLSFGGHNRMEAALSALLVARFPSLELLRFTNSGTEANMMALVTARAVTGRGKVLVIDGGYHGGVLTFGGGGSPINAPFDFVPAPYNDSEATVALIERHGPDLAAAILEPMIGAGGCIPAEPGYLQAIRAATRAQGTILIFDEVMTSRLAPGGLQEALGIAPDMTTLGKYIGGGMSFGAFGGRADIMRRFDPRDADAFPHAGTFNNNVLTMSAGLAAMGQVFPPEAVAPFNARGDSLRERLNALAREQGAPMQATGRGSMMTLHFLEGAIRSPADAARGNAELRELLFFDLLARGFYTARRGMINLSLPIADADCDALVEAVADFLVERRSLLSQPPP